MTISLPDFVSQLAGNPTLLITVLLTLAVILVNGLSLIHIFYTITQIQGWAMAWNKDSPAPNHIESGVKNGAESLIQSPLQRYEPQVF